MFRKFYFLFIGLFSFTFCLTNTFADDNGEPVENIITEGNFAFPTADGAAYVQGNAEFERTPEVIIGDPDFEKMRDLPINSQDYQLGRKVGMILVLNRARDRVGICTGFLVGPDLFMTSHHCIHDDIGLLPLGTSTAIFMDYYQDEDVDSTYGGLTARVSAVVHADALKDYALLRLDRPIGNTYGWLDLDTTTRPNVSQSVKLMSHNDGRSKEIVRRNSQIYEIPPGHPLFNVPSAIAYLADSEGGSSGSPVFLQEGTSVIAIHHSGYATRTGVPIHNAGSLMSHIVPEIQQYLPQPAVYMYWVDAGTDKIQRANLDGSNVRDIVTTGLRTPNGVATDLKHGKMYWTDSSTDKIQRANLDGSNIEDIVTTGLRTPTSITVDLRDDKMYWIDSGTDKIQRANLDGSNIKDIVTTGLNTPTDIAVDLRQDKVYWVDSGTDKIQRANLDGSNIEDIVTTGLNTPTGIAVDMQGSKMYWIDAGTGKIQRANLDGSNIEDIVTTGLRTPTDIAVDPEDREDPLDGKVYWIDAGTDKIQRANLDGSNIKDIVTTGLNTPTGIALGIPQVVPPRPSNAAPDFGNAIIASITATVGQAITGRILPEATDADGDTLTYSITPDLPTGLNFDPATRALTGTPTKEMTQTAYTYKVTDGKASDTIRFFITVNPDSGPGPGPGENPADVNSDGQVTVIDLAIVALFYGTRVPAGADLPADVNDDGIVNILDLTVVAEAIDAAGNADALSAADVQGVLEAIEAQVNAIEGVAEAPARVSTSQQALLSGVAYQNVATAFEDTKHLATGDVQLQKWMPLFKEILLILTEMQHIPETTALLPNYPNPFNPETWIPYHLATEADVTLTIYDVRGSVVRELVLGHQLAGVYQSKHRAASWDGRNQIGEHVASGVYFYTLTAGDFTATRKLLIAK